MQGSQLQGFFTQGEMPPKKLCKNIEIFCLWMVCTVEFNRLYTIFGKISPHELQSGLKVQIF